MRFAKWRRHARVRPSQVDALLHALLFVGDARRLAGSNYRILARNLHSTANSRQRREVPRFRRRAERPSWLEDFLVFARATAVLLIDLARPNGRNGSTQRLAPPHQEDSNVSQSAYAPRQLRRACFRSRRPLRKRAGNASDHQHWRAGPGRGSASAIIEPRRRGAGGRGGFAHGSVGRRTKARDAQQRGLRRLRRHQYAGNTDAPLRRSARSIGGCSRRLRGKPLRPRVTPFGARFECDARLSFARRRIAPRRHADELLRRRRRLLSDRPALLSRDRGAEGRQRAQRRLVDAWRRDQFHLADGLHRGLAKLPRD